MCAIAPYAAQEALFKKAHLALSKAAEPKLLNVCPKAKPEGRNTSFAS